MPSKKKWLPQILLPAFFLLTAGLIFSFVDQPASKAQAHNLENDLPVVGSLANLQELLQQAGLSERSYDLILEDELPMETPMKAATKSDAPQAEGSAADFSSTNVQVQGVDEADIIKTDGTYIYQVQGQELTIVKAYPAAEMNLVNRFSFADPDFRARDIYVDGNYLVVLGASSYNHLPQPAPLAKLKEEVYPPYYYPQSIPTTKVLVFDSSDKAHLKKLREVELQGSAVSTRKIGSSVYIVANRYINRYPDYNNDVNPELPLPAYKDSLSDSSFKQIGTDKIRYFPDALYPSYIMVAALDLNKLDAPLDVAAYLGNGENIYASMENMYVAVGSYNYDNRPRLSGHTSTTSVYKFALKPGTTEYAGKGSVPGLILNQFSMDEERGYFRIATTSDGLSSDGLYLSQNNVYILNSELNICGRVENIAPGEHIYSTRFMGDRLYMVTFRTVDPFFAIDLGDPNNPKVMGQLKIPGYSNYLHPYDDTHIIGFGKDTIEMKGWNGESQAYYQGMKMAIFDVTDITNPREMSKELIGDRGTDSEMLYNHKALLFERDKNLLAFPVNLMEVSGSSDKTAQELEYGSFTFQGAYIYNVDLQNGFKLKGRITHLSPEDYLKAGDYWYDSERNISRILYIGDTLYTLSPSMIMANDMADLKPIKTLQF